MQYYLIQAAGRQYLARCVFVTKVSLLFSVTYFLAR